MQSKIRSYSPDDILIINYRLSLETAETVLAQLGDTESHADVFKTVRFFSDADSCNYRLRFTQTLRLSPREWTIAIDWEAPGWLAENARDSEFRDWVWILFLCAEHQARFEKAVKLSAPHVEVWTGTSDAEALR